jgi:hypothetical protein
VVTGEKSLEGWGWKQMPIFLMFGKTWYLVGNHVSKNV